MISLICITSCSKIYNKVHKEKIIVPETIEKSKVYPKSEMDQKVDHNVEYKKYLQKHISNGKKYIKENNPQKAVYEFLKSLQAKEDNFEAYLGLSLSYFELKQFKESYEALENAKKYKNNNINNKDYNMLIMKLNVFHFNRLDGIWFNEIDSAFNRLVANNPKNPEIYYIMGIACKQVYFFNRAKSLFNKTNDIGKGYLDLVHKEIMEIKTIEKSNGLNENEKFGLYSKVNRGDLAKLLVNEFVITNLINPPYSITAKEKITAIDIKNNPNRSEIESIIIYNIKGLKPYENNTFEPEMPVTKGEFAVILEDILLRLIGKQKLINYYQQKQSPFIDINCSNPFFYPSLICTSLNILSKSISGEFNPQNSVSGSQALMSIRTVKYLLKSNF